MRELGSGVKWVGLSPRGHLGLLFRAGTRVSRVRYTPQVENLRGPCVKKFLMLMGSSYGTIPPLGPVISTVLVEVFSFSISKWKDVLMVKRCAQMTPLQ